MELHGIQYNYCVRTSTARVVYICVLCSSVLDQCIPCHYHRYYSSCHYIQVQEHRQVMAVPSLEPNGGDGIQGRESVQSHDVGCY